MFKGARLTIRSTSFHFAEALAIMSLFEFFYNQLLFTVSSQTIIVTGSNVGLGLEAARHFTRLNADKVILAVRSFNKGSDAKKLIEESTKRTKVVEVW